MTEELAQTQNNTMILFDEKIGPRVLQIAETMSQGGVMVPDHLQNKPADCVAIVCQAYRWGMDPFAVAQATHVIKGKLGYESKLVNAVLTSLGAISGAPDYEYFGDWGKIDGKKKWAESAEDGLGVKVTCKLKCGLFKSLDCHMTSAVVRNSPLWKSAPRQQLAYLGLKMWARLYAPGAMLGVYTPDELRTIDVAAVEVSGSDSDIKGGTQTEKLENMLCGESEEVLEDDIYLNKAIKGTGLPLDIVNSYLADVQNSPIEAGQTYHDLPVSWKDRIVADPDSFAAKVEEYYA